MMRKIVRLLMQYCLGIGTAYILGMGIFYICRFIPHTFLSILAKYFGNEFYYDLYIMAFLAWPIGLSVGVSLVDIFSRKKPKPNIRTMAIVFFAALLGIVLFNYVILPLLGNIIIFGLNRGADISLLVGGLFCLIAYNTIYWLWEKYSKLKMFKISEKMAEA